jgi:hypothetical protein
MTPYACRFDRQATLSTVMAGISPGHDAEELELFVINRLDASAKVYCELCIIPDRKVSFFPFERRCRVY